MAYKHKKKASTEAMVLKCTDSDGQVAQITIQRGSSTRRNFAFIGTIDPSEKGAAIFFTCIKDWDIQNEKGKPLPLTLENFLELDDALIKDFIDQAAESGFLIENSTPTSVTTSDGASS